MGPCASIPDWLLHILRVVIAIFVMSTIANALPITASSETPIQVDNTVAHSPIVVHHHYSNALHNNPQLIRPSEKQQFHKTKHSSNDTTIQSQPQLRHNRTQQSSDTSSVSNLQYAANKKYQINNYNTTMCNQLKCITGDNKATSNIPSVDSVLRARKRHKRKLYVVDRGVNNKLETEKNPVMDLNIANHTNPTNNSTEQIVTSNFETKGRTRAATPHSATLVMTSSGPTTPQPKIHRCLSMTTTIMAAQTFSSTIQGRTSETSLLTTSGAEPTTLKPGIHLCHSLSTTTTTIQTSTSTTHREHSGTSVMTTSGSEPTSPMYCSGQPKINRCLAPTMTTQTSTITHIIPTSVTLTTHGRTTSDAGSKESLRFTKPLRYTVHSLLEWTYSANNVTYDPSDTNTRKEESTTPQFSKNIATNQYNNTNNSYSPSKITTEESSTKMRTKTTDKLATMTHSVPVSTGLSSGTVSIKATTFEFVEKIASATTQTNETENNGEMNNRSSEISGQWKSTEELQGSKTQPLLKTVEAFSTPWSIIRQETAEVTPWRSTDEEISSKVIKDDAEGSSKVSRRSFSTTDTLKRETRLSSEVDATAQNRRTKDVPEIPVSQPIVTAAREATATMTEIAPAKVFTPSHEFKLNEHTTQVFQNAGTVIPIPSSRTGSFGEKYTETSIISARITLSDKEENDERTNVLTKHIEESGSGLADPTRPNNALDESSEGIPAEYDIGKEHLSSESIAKSEKDDYAIISQHFTRRTTENGVFHTLYNDPVTGSISRGSSERGAEHDDGRKTKDIDVSESRYVTVNDVIIAHNSQTANDKPPSHIPSAFQTAKTTHISHGTNHKQISSSSSNHLPVSLQEAVTTSSTLTSGVGETHEATKKEDVQDISTSQTYDNHETSETVDQSAVEKSMTTVHEEITTEELKLPVSDGMKFANDFTAASYTPIRSDVSGRSQTLNSKLQATTMPIQSHVQTTERAPHAETVHPANNSSGPDTIGNTDKENEATLRSAADLSDVSLRSTNSKRDSENMVSQATTAETIDPHRGTVKVQSITQQQATTGTNKQPFWLYHTKFTDYDFSNSPSTSRQQTTTSSTVEVDSTSSIATVSAENVSITLMSSSTKNTTTSKPGQIFEQQLKTGSPLEELRSHRSTTQTNEFESTQIETLIKLTSLKEQTKSQNDQDTSFDKRTSKSSLISSKETTLPKYNVTTVTETIKEQTQSKSVQKQVSSSATWSNVPLEISRTSSSSTLNMHTMMHVDQSEEMSEKKDLLRGTTNPSSGDDSTAFQNSSTATNKYIFQMAENASQGITETLLDSVPSTGHLVASSKIAQSTPYEDASSSRHAVFMSSGESQKAASTPSMTQNADKETSNKLAIELSQSTDSKNIPERSTKISGFGEPETISSGEHLLNKTVALLTAEKFSTLKGYSDESKFPVTVAPTSLSSNTAKIKNTTQWSESSAESEKLFNNWQMSSTKSILPEAMETLPHKTDTQHFQVSRSDATKLPHYNGTALVGINETATEVEGPPGAFSMYHTHDMKILTEERKTPTVTEERNSMTEGLIEPSSGLKTSNFVTLIENQNPTTSDEIHEGKSKTITYETTAFDWKRTTKWADHSETVSYNVSGLKTEKTSIFEGIQTNMIELNHNNSLILTTSVPKIYTGQRKDATYDQREHQSTAKSQMPLDRKDETTGMSKWEYLEATTPKHLNRFPADASELASYVQEENVPTHSRTMNIISQTLKYTDGDSESESGTMRDYSTTGSAKIWSVQESITTPTNSISFEAMELPSKTVEKEMAITTTSIRNRYTNETNIDYLVTSLNNESIQRNYTLEDNANDITIKFEKIALSSSTEERQLWMSSQSIPHEVMTLSANPSESKPSERNHFSGITPESKPFGEHKYSSYSMDSLQIKHNLSISLPSSVEMLSSRAFSMNTDKSVQRWSTESESTSSETEFTKKSPKPDESPVEMITESNQFSRSNASSSRSIYESGRFSAAPTDQLRTSYGSTVHEDARVPTKAAKSEMYPERTQPSPTNLSTRMNATVSVSTTLTTEEMTTTLPPYCKMPCPSMEWREGKDYCYRWLNQSLFSSYDIALQYCLNDFTMIGMEDFAYAENIQLFIQMSTSRTNLVFLFAPLTAEYKAKRMVNIANIEQSTVFQVSVVGQVSSDANVHNVGTICKLNKYCTPVVCDFDEFIQNEQIYLELPNQKYLQSGAIIGIPCKANPSNIFNVTYACTNTGRFQPDPSDKRCVPEVKNDSQYVPPIRESCSECHPAGTERCVAAPGGFKCICKEGWSMLSCWMAPIHCQTNSCSEHGVCIEMVNDKRCACDEGWKGTTCALNASLIFDITRNPNASAEYDGLDGEESLKEAEQMVTSFGWVQGGLGVLTVTALLSSIIMAALTSGSDDSDFDPQALFQSQRLRAIVLAAGGSFYARNPYRYNLDIYYGCRFYYWFINTAYSIGQCLLTAEAANVEKLFGAVQFNKWKRGQDSTDTAALTYLVRLPPCYIVPFAVIAATVIANWNSVCRPWSCIGSFSSHTFPLQLALIALNGGLMLASIALCESAYLSKKNCVEAEIRRCEYFLSNWPYELSKRMLCVERNLSFVPVGSILHFGCWLAVILATDVQDVAVTVIAVIFLFLYSAFIIAQLIFTRPELYKYVTIFSMILLPKSMSPNFEFSDMLTRDEVLGSWKPKKYLKEKVDEQKRKENDEQQVALKIQRDNENLFRKYPNLPPVLLFNIPEKASPSRFPSAFPLSPIDNGYISEWNRMMMQRRWTEDYMGYRRTGMSVDESIKATKSAFIDADDYIGNLTLGGLLTWNDWENRIRTMDIYSDDVLMKHKIENPFLSQSTTSLSSLTDIEVSALRVYADETLRQQIIKAPPVKLNMQVRMMQRKWEETLKERNAPFDAIYWDDPIVAHLTQLCDKETIAAILNVQEAEIERPKYAQSRRPISMNPRKRPLDDFWFDPDMPGFIGPHNLSTFDQPVFDPSVRTRRFFNKILERQWKSALDDDLEFELALLHLRSKGYSAINFFA